MIIHGNEVLEPEELARLGKVFDEAWASVSPAAGGGGAEQRTILASILLRLANLRQLGPEQLKATALRIFQSEPTQAFRPVAVACGAFSVEPHRSGRLLTASYRIASPECI